MGQLDYPEKIEMIPLCRGHGFDPGERNHEMNYTECLICGRRWNDEALLRLKKEGVKID